MKRYVAGTAKHPRKNLAARLETEVRKRWQPQIRAKAAESGDHRQHRHRHPRPQRLHRADRHHRRDRIRHLTVALPPQYAARLFDAQQQGATDQRPQEIASEGLKEVYFQDGGRHP